jgi:hypothetical protein
MPQPSLGRADLVRIVAGDATHIDVIARHPQSEIARVVEGMPEANLTITPSAVKRVLLDFKRKEITTEQAKAWASFVRRGYISTRETGGIQPILISYQGDCEDEIAHTISRLEELGDLVDGTIDDDELRGLIGRLEG